MFIDLVVFSLGKRLYLYIFGLTYHGIVLFICYLHAFLAFNWLSIWLTVGFLLHGDVVQHLQVGHALYYQVHVCLLKKTHLKIFDVWHEQQEILDHSSYVLDWIITHIDRYDGGELASKSVKSS